MITISAPWARTMSKSFRLVDELGGSKKEVTKTPIPSKEKRVSCPKQVVSDEAVWETDDQGKDTPRITSVTPMDGGEWVSVMVRVGKERKRFRLLTEQYAALHPAEGVASPEILEALEAAGKLCDAIRKGTELLGYGAVSKRRLTQKLTARSFDREIAEMAVSYLYERGLLPETDDAIRFAEQGVRKLWGPHRIRDDLFARGFPSEVIAIAMDHLEDVDFVENCGRVIAKKYGGIPKDQGAIKKMIAALMRLGYTSDQIRETLR